MILGKVSAALSLKRLNILRPNPCQMKVQGNIFKLRIGHFYVRLLLHGVICVTKCQRPSNCFFFILSFSWPLFGQRFVHRIVEVLRDIWFKITQKHQIWRKCSLYHTISISDGRRDGRPPEWP